MPVTLLDLYCLNALCDDYENVASIQAGVRWATHGNINITEEEVKEGLIRLYKEGLVEVYDYDPLQTAFLLSEIAGDWNRKWFFIAAAGRKELDQNESKLG